MIRSRTSLLVVSLCLAALSSACADGVKCPRGQPACSITHPSDAADATPDTAQQDTVEQDSAQQDSAQQDSVEQDSVEQDSGVPDTVSDDTLVADTAVPDTDTVGECTSGSYADGEGGCTPCTVCSATQFEASACTATANRECTDCSAVVLCSGTLSCTSASDSHCSQCTTGYEQLSNGAACTDIDECAANNGGCSANAACDNVPPGSRTCTCDDGFVGDGVSCAVECEGTTTTLEVLAGYLSPVTFPVGVHPRAVSTGDLNGDGDLDLVTPNNGSTGTAAVSVLLGDGTGGFHGSAASCTAADFDGGNGGYEAALADFNGDGKLDIVTSNFESANATVLINTTPLGSSTPTFAAPAAFATGTGSSNMAVVDLNDDGRPDVVTANFKASNVSVLINATAVGASGVALQPQVSFSAGTQPNGAFAADFNGDGKPDLAIANYSALQVGSVTVLLNTTGSAATTPTFATGVNFTVGAGPDHMTGADLNHDGKPDLVVANQGARTASVLLNTTAQGATTPSFAAQVTYDVLPAPPVGRVTLADMDGDGELDLVVPSRDMSISYGLGDGTFSAPVTLFSSQTVDPLAVAIGDFDGNGAPDFAVGDILGNYLSIILAE